MKAWITKYALTTGIWEADVEHHEKYDGIVTILTDAKGQKASTTLWMISKAGWQRSEKEALVRAIAMGEKKLASLAKSVIQIGTLLKTWRQRLEELQ